MELVTAPMRQGKRTATFAEAGQFRGKIGQPLDNQMNDLPFPLHTAAQGDHTD